jgi:hypothetical protein
VYVIQLYGGVVNYHRSGKRLSELRRKLLDSCNCVVYFLFNSASKSFLLEVCLVSASDIFRDFEEMIRGMEREFEEEFKDIERTIPKDSVREYETAEGGKVREYGPFVYDNRA